jgi:hypothetical protein
MRGEAIRAINGQMLRRADCLTENKSGDNPALGIGPETQSNGFRAVILNDFIEFCGYFIQRLFPGYLSPFPVAAFSHTLHGMLYSVGMIEEFIIGNALYAQLASVLRVVRITRDLRYSSIFPLNHDAATGHTSFANRSDDFFSHFSPSAK